MSFLKSLPRSLSVVLALSSLSFAVPTPADFPIEAVVDAPLEERASWPYAPFTTSGRYILDSRGTHVVYAGVNWPGAADTMIPEGLQYSSIDAIVSKIASLGMNVIRLTYAIEMIDDIYSNGKDTTLLASFTKALGTSAGTTVYNKVLKNNPTFTSSTTRLQVFDAVAAAAAKHNIWIHLDNHVSKAEWCCGTDGNAWFGASYFNVNNWVRGLGYMAKHAAAWPNLVSMSLRNELRDPSVSSLDYGWTSWYKNIVPAANAIHSANSNVLIFLSGLGYDTDMSPIPTGASLGGGYTFSLSSFSYSNKLVLEIHNYATSSSSCSSLESSLNSDGFRALSTTDSAVKNHMPVVMTEFGEDMGSYTNTYATCIKSYLTGLKAGWTVWVIAGSYYIRSGSQDYDETWGLLNHDWSGWRNTNTINNFFIPMVKASLS